MTTRSVPEMHRCAERQVDLAHVFALCKPFSSVTKTGSSGTMNGREYTDGWYAAVEPYMSNPTSKPADGEDACDLIVTLDAVVDARLETVAI